MNFWIDRLKLKNVKLSLKMLSFYKMNVWIDKIKLKNVKLRLIFFFSDKQQMFYFLSFEYL